MPPRTPINLWYRPTINLGASGESRWLALELNAHSLYGGKSQIGEQTSQSRRAIPLGKLPRSAAPSGANGGPVAGRRRLRSSWHPQDGLESHLARVPWNRSGRPMETAHRNLHPVAERSSRPDSHPHGIAHFQAPKRFTRLGHLRLRFRLEAPQNLILRKALHCVLAV